MMALKGERVVTAIDGTGLHKVQPTRADTFVKTFFFGLCCARHYNCGSH